MKVFSLITVFLISQAIATNAAKPSSVDRRINVAPEWLGTKVKVLGKQFSSGSPGNIIDGSYADSSVLKLKGLPATVILSLGTEREVSTVRIFPGILKYAANPSSECRPLSYKLDGYINGGWIPLAYVKNVDLKMIASKMTQKNVFYQHDFPPMRLQKLRISINKSSDTGKRTRSPQKVIVPESGRMTAIREIQIFEHAVRKGGGARGLSQFVYGDFRLPFYRNSACADLILCLKKIAKKDIPLTIKINSPNNLKVLKTLNFSLKKGENKFALNISDLKSGRYPVTITNSNKNYLGKIERLLRIENIRKTESLASGTNVSGKKLFMIDSYHIEKKNNLNVEVNPGKPYLAAKFGLFKNKSHWLNRVMGLRLSSDNKLLYRYQSVVHNKLKWCYAVSELKNLKQWKIFYGTPQLKIIHPLKKHTSPSARGLWKQKISDEKANFRFYNPKKDGKPPLNEILVKFTGTKHKKFDGLPIPYRSTYAIWEKKSGEILFLSKKPLAVDRWLPGGNEFEKETDTSDNFGGQFLSEDGKTLYYITARVVKRFAPFIVEYDNQVNSNRLLTVFYTHDGFNWKKQFILPLSKKDNWSIQQYGANIMKDPDSDIYWGFLLSYHSQRQQIYIDVMFSRDMINWKRPGTTPFIANSNVPGNWLFGLIMKLSFPKYRVKNLNYHSMISILPWPHFYIREMNDPASLKRRFGPRYIEDWPFFKKVGGYKGLSKSMRSLRKRALGVVTSRPDGYVALVAGNTTGTMVSRLVKATGKMTLNAQANSNGWIKIEFLNEKNLPIKGFSKRFQGDSLSYPIFDQLPFGKFKIRITMKNAKLFVLNFIKDRK